MLGSEIKVGGQYRAKMSNKLVVVEVLDIRIRRVGSRDQKVYEVRNLSTSRVITFKSGSKFRAEVPKV